MGSNRHRKPWAGNWGRAATGGLAIAVMNACLSADARAQVVLDGPNVNGTVGLRNETHGSSQVYIWWAGGNVDLQLANGDRDFSARVQPDAPLHFTIYLYSLQGGTNAYLQQSVNNVAGPSAGATTPLSLDFERDAGRIAGAITVLGGSVSRVVLNAQKSHSSTEYYYGSATAATAPFVAVLPFPALAAVNVSGTAVLRANAGCDVPVTLAPQQVSVPAEGTVQPGWSFDLTSETCTQGTLQGQVTYTGLGGSNADATGLQRYVQVSGPVNRSQSTDAAGSYRFTDLSPGQYYLYDYAFFNAPYGNLYPSGGAAQPVTAGQVVTRDLAREVGTLHTRVAARGAWSLADTTSAYGYVSTIANNSFVGQGLDFIDRSTGATDWVVLAGDSYLSSLQFYFYQQDAARYSSQYFGMDFDRSAAPVRQSVVGAARVDAGALDMDTSEALVVVQPANSAVGLGRLRLSGNSTTYVNGTYTGSRRIDLTSQALTTPGNSVAVLVRGVPGTYRMTAAGDGTDGATYSKQFDLVLGQPQNTSTGTGVVSPISLTDSTTGKTVEGSITFGNVTVAGDTTVSVSGSGPNPKEGFRVFGAGSMAYYDIQTTAQFTGGVTVCLEYDDPGNPRQEERLSLQHYVCQDDTNSNCQWEDITSAGYPDTAANRICGVTNSFSIFALFEALDADGDTVLDDQDNCPAVPNATQSNVDGDAFGDACDSDVDGDGVDDTADNCSLVPNPLQENLDKDLQGDACDADRDGDDILDTVDNCSAHPNTSQGDFDGDGLGDACDTDDDADTVLDTTDVCAGTAPGAPVLVNGCSSLQALERACPRTETYRNHGQFVQCVAHEAQSQLGAGLITTREKDAIVASSATSTIGRK